MTVISAKKNGPMTQSCIRAHHTLNFGESLTISLYSWGFSDPQMQELCLLTIPDTWKQSSLENKTRLRNLLLFSILCKVSKAQSPYIWSSGWNKQKQNILCIPIHACYQFNLTQLFPEAFKFKIRQAFCRHHNYIAVHHFQ